MCAAYLIDVHAIDADTAGIASVSFPDPLRSVAMGDRGMKHGEHFDSVATSASLHPLTHWTVTFANPPPGWVVGQEGRITMLRNTFPLEDKGA